MNKPSFLSSAGGFAHVLLVAAFVTLLALPASAEDDSSAADTAAARALAIEGLKLADAGQCAEAIDKLSRAEKLHHAPIVLGRLGECQIAEGKIVDGTEALRKLLREPLPANPTPALVRARERAQAALDAAKPKIATLVISVKGPRENLTVTVDGQPVPSVLLDGSRPTDPGEHQIEASAPGYLKATQRVSVGAGEKQAVAFELQPDPEAAKRASAATATVGSGEGRLTTGQSTPTELDAGAASRAAPNRTGAYVAWTIGGAALVAGAVSGVVALRDKSDLDGKCPRDVCPPSANDQLELAKTAGTISTVSFGVAGAGLVLGTILYVTAGSGSHREAPRATVRARPWIGLGALGVDGHF